MRMNLSEEEIKFMNSEQNKRKLVEIDQAWPAKLNIARPGRLLVREGVLQKMCRKAAKDRYFFLFNDVMIYGSAVGGGTYKHAHVLPLSDMTVTNVEDSTDGSNAFQVNHAQKSFLVFSPNAQEKSNWMKALKRFTGLCQEATGKSGAEARAVWIPDKKVKTCMVADCDEGFSLTRRRHHCRNCGAVVCGTCSNAYKAVLNQQKPERVCRVCHAKLGGKKPSDVPVLGKASTETGPKEKDAAASKSAAADPEYDDVSLSSSDSDSDDDDDEPAAVIHGSSAALAAGQGAKEVADLSKDEKKMHDLSDADRLAIMEEVKQGNMTTDEAMKKIEKEKSQIPAKNIKGPHARALYSNDDPEQGDELVFFEGDIIILTRKVNEEWLEGHVATKASSTKGIFPSAFVEIITPI